MNKRIKKLWIKALRGGKYKQARGFLRRNGDAERFCCLGVLCDLYRKEEGGAWSDHVFEANGLYSSSVLPEPVHVWADLDDENPLLGRTAYATGLNDQGKNFNFIADRIEKYL